MPVARRLHRLRRASLLAGLAALLAATALTLTQCRMVEDRILGVEVLHQRPTECLAGCARTLGQALVVEARRYVEALKGCNRDPVCIALERARHQQVLARLHAEFRACVKACHHQGGGGGG